MSKLGIDFDIFNSQTFSKITFVNEDMKNFVKDDRFFACDYTVIGYFKNNKIENKQKIISEKIFAFEQQTEILNELYNIDFNEYVEREKFDANSGKSIKITLPKNNSWKNLPLNILCLAVGSGNTDDCRKAGLELGRKTVGQQSVYVPFIDELSKINLNGNCAITENVKQEELEYKAKVAFFHGILLSCYRQTKISSQLDENKPVEEIYVSTNNLSQTKKAYEEAFNIAQTTILARTLECVPSNIKNPPWLAENIKKLAEKTNVVNGELVYECLDEKQLKERGFNSILAVGSGSKTPPRLVTLTWKPNNLKENSPKIALVGKGITYDTGGLSLKPRMSMIPMKTDMSGSATVISAVLAAARAGLNVQVCAIAPLAENAMGGASYRPSDVVKTYNGTTVEVVNTDAEGRMVLADGLGYAIKDIKPDIVVDIATLTGSATMGLGRFHAATYSNDDKVWQTMNEAGKQVGENTWRMPLIEDYRQFLCSPIADICHAQVVDFIGAGSVTAALFLQKFIADCKWCHLDIAGVGRAGTNSGEVTQNQPTGYGAAMLYSFIKSYN